MPTIADLGITADADDAEMARAAATDTRENFMLIFVLLLVWSSGRREEDSMPSTLVLEPEVRYWSNAIKYEVGFAANPVLGFSP